MAGLILLLALGALLYWLALVGWTFRLLTCPPRQTYASAVSKARPGDPGELDTPLAFESWSLQSVGRDIKVWEIPGRAPGGPVAIVTHGWGSGKVNALKRVPLLAGLCTRVMLWDLPGHGESGGRCTLGLREVDDLLALIERVGVERPIVLCGSSMGAGVSIAAAARSKAVALVVAEAPYRLAPTPARNVLRSRHAPTALNLAPALSLLGLLASGRWTGPRLDSARFGTFDRAAHAAGLACPLLVLHGDSDTTCPIEDGKAIALAAPCGRFLVISGGTHHNLWKDASCRATMERAYTDAIADLSRP